MVNAYREIASSPDYVDLERKRVMNRLDEGQALRHAAKVATEQANAQWQGVVADKDAENARLREQLAELQSQLGKDK
jgi:hypothetical protein